MTTITIDEIQYDAESLSETAKAQVASLQFVQQELVRLEAKIAVYRTAEASYAKALKDEISL